MCSLGVRPEPSRYQKAKRGSSLSSGEQSVTGPNESSSPETMTINDHVARLRVDLRLYRLIAVQKAAYRIAARCTVILGSIHDDQIDVEIRLVSKGGNTELREATRLLFQEMLDQELREKVAAETAPLRALLLAIAYSRTGLAPKS